MAGGVRPPFAAWEQQRSVRRVRLASTAYSLARSLARAWLAVTREVAMQLAVAREALEVWRIAIVCAKTEIEC
jgi:hypothetical protein